MAGNDAPAAGSRVVMLLENNPYPADVRVRMEAESLARAGYDVLVIAPRGEGEPARASVGGVRVRRYRLPEFGASKRGFIAEYLWANLQLQARGALELLRGARILHLHNPPDTLFPVAFLARALGRRVVFDHHDLTPELFAERFGASPVITALRLMEKATFRCADAVLAPNESHREVALGRGGMPPEAVTVVRNGPRAAAISTASVREGPLADPHLVFLGAMGPQDGVGQIPGLMSLLGNGLGLRGARLTMIGDGSERDAVEQMLVAQGDSPRVRFTGRVPHEEVPALLATADICIDPAPPGALNDRSTMVKVAEYMAAGKPIVAYPLIETERTAGTAALYARRGDVEDLAAQVARLAANPDLRKSLAEAALNRVRDLTWESSERALLAAYRRLG
jgi:glycosyltransferase involved in cell wall biosynthesis